MQQALEKIAAVVGGKNVLSKPIDLVPYKDSPTLRGPSPSAVIFPTSTAEVAKIMAIANEFEIPVVARCAGTCASGGINNYESGNVILEMAKMDKILEINILDRYVAVEPGISNFEVQEALKPYGYFFAPDPASFIASAIGGNIAENAGGMHCVKYGVTTNNVLGLEFVLNDGTIVVSNGPIDSGTQYNLTGLMNGSEGTFGIVTKAWLKILKIPEEIKTLVGVFPSADDICQSVSEIIRRGISPCCLEFIDSENLNAVEKVIPIGYPLNSELLLVELDGFAGTLDDQAEEIDAILREHHAKEVRIARSDEERESLWRGRRHSQDCVVSLSSGSYLQSDPAVPPAQLPKMLSIMSDLSRKYKLVIENVAHVGDGNFHPQILFDDKNEEEVERAHLCFRELNLHCIKLGGTITGEHGIGLEKIDSMKDQFTDDELSYMSRVKLSFDCRIILNPGKVIPQDIFQKEVQYVRELADVQQKGGPDPVSFGAEPAIVNIRSLDPEPYALAGKKPGFAFRPQNATEVATIVTLANKYNLRVAAWEQGGRGIRDFGPDYAVISMEGLDRVVDLDPGNVTVTVETGMQLKDLQSALSMKGYLLPVDPVGQNSSAIGELIATNNTGSLKLKYGNFNNMVLGVQAVTGEGKIINYGGKMIKNVAGYDLNKLFIGSCGTLGIITQVILKMSPMPERVLYRTYATDCGNTFLEFIDSVQNTDFNLTSFDFAVSGSKYYVNLCLSGRVSSVAKQIEILEHLVGENLKLLDETEDPRLEGARVFREHYTTLGQPHRTVIKSAILFSNIPKWMEIVNHHGQNADVSMYGHAGNGIAYAIVAGGDDEAAGICDRIQAGLQGSFAFGVHTREDDIGILPDGEDRQDNRVSRRLKKILDPKNVLNPGRLSGGKAI